MASSAFKIALLPLDSRPVCLGLPLQLAQMAGITLRTPEKDTLGQLKQPADEAALFQWIQALSLEKLPLIAALDTVAYGGLIASRVGEETLEVIKARLNRFYEAILPATILGFSSIMRIPSYNSNEEEPTYWAQYGTDLFRYSAALHQQDEATQKTLEAAIPQAVREDFLGRRNRNHQVNQWHLDALKHKRLAQIVFCQDDTGQYGLNVAEAQDLEQAIQQEALRQLAWVQTGADEVAACFLSYWATQLSDPSSPKTPAVAVVYTDSQKASWVTRYDGVPISTLVAQKIQACGAEYTANEDTADLVLWVHTPLGDTQGDHIMSPESVNHFGGEDTARKILDRLKQGQKLILADLAYANGSDPALTKALLSQNDPLASIYGYAGWNTGGNTMGTALSMGCLRWWAEEQGTFDEEAFKKLSLVRWVDDGLYQSTFRQTLKQQFGADAFMSEHLRNDTLRRALNTEMAPAIEAVKQSLELHNAVVTCDFPCQRWFEIEVRVS